MEKKSIVRGGVRWPHSVWQRLEELARQRSLKPMQVVRDIVTSHFTKTADIGDRMAMMETEIKTIKEQMGHYRTMGPTRKVAS